MLTHQAIIESETTGHEAASPQEELAQDVAKGIEADLDKADCVIFASVRAEAVDMDRDFPCWEVRLADEYGSLIAQESPLHMRRYWRGELECWAKGQVAKLFSLDQESE